MPIMFGRWNFIKNSVEIIQKPRGIQDFTWRISIKSNLSARWIGNSMKKKLRIRNTPTRSNPAHTIEVNIHIDPELAKFVDALAAEADMSPKAFSEMVLQRGLDSRN